MITRLQFVKFAEESGWIVIEKGEKPLDNFFRYLTPSGQKVLVEFKEDGSIQRIYP